MLLPIASEEFVSFDLSRNGAPGMAAAAASFEQLMVDDVLVVRFSKQRLYDADKIEELTAALLELAEGLTTDKVVLNLHGIDYFSSSGIGALIRFSKRLGQKKAQLRLCELQPMVEEIMLLQRLDKVFDIDADEGSAIINLS